MLQKSGYKLKLFALLSIRQDLEVARMDEPLHNCHQKLRQELHQR